MTGKRGNYKNQQVLERSWIQEYQREYGKLLFGNFIILVYQDYIFILKFFYWHSHKILQYTGRIHHQTGILIQQHSSLWKLQPPIKSEVIIPEDYWISWTDWSLHKCKSRTECSFGGLAYNKVLFDDLFAENNQ